MRIKRNVCSKMWTDTSIDFRQKSIRHCCKQDLHPLSIEEINKLGKDVFEKYSLNISNRKQMVIDDELPDSCLFCKSQGENSLKHVWNTWSDNFVKKHEKNLIDATLTQYIEIDIGNSCNLACIYCGPWASSTWAKELNQKNNVKEDADWDLLIKQKMIEWIDSLDVETDLTLNILGGEPLLLVETYEIIDELKKVCHKFNKKPKLMITTNLQPKPVLLDRLLKLIESTKDIFEWIFAISIEDVGYRAEMVRYHLDWTDFISNLNAIKYRVDYIYFTNTISIVSLPYFSEFVNWAFDIMSDLNYDTQWALSCNYVQTDGKSNYRFTDSAYLKPEMVNKEEIIETFNRRLSEHRIPDTSIRQQQFIEHINNMYNRLGSLQVDKNFVNFWKTMGNRRNLDYINNIDALKSLINEYERDVI